MAEVQWSRKEERGRSYASLWRVCRRDHTSACCSAIQLIAWFIDQMSMDFSTDLYSLYCETNRDNSQLVKHLNYEIEQLKQDKTDYTICIDRIAKERDDLRTAKAKVEDQMYGYKATAYKYERLVQGIREITS